MPPQPVAAHPQPPQGVPAVRVPRSIIPYAPVYYPTVRQFFF